MSDWSSFEKDKAIADDWRTFQIIPIEEGLFDTLRGMTGAGGSLESLLATQTIKEYQEAYNNLLKIWVTSHKSDPRLKAHLQDYIDNFEQIVYTLHQDPKIQSAHGRRAIQSIADFGDEELRSRSHLIKLVQADKSHVPPQAQDADGDGQPDEPVDTDGDGQPDEPVDTDGDGKPDTPAAPDKMTFRLGPLSQKLKQAGLSSAAIVAILRNLKKQLVANNVPVRLQEGLDNLLQELQIEIDEAKGAEKQRRKQAAARETERRRKAAADKSKQDAQKNRKGKKKKQKDKRHGKTSKPSDPPPEKEDSFYKRKAAGQTTTAGPGPSPQKGTIKVSAIHQWLKGVDSNLNSKKRKQAVKIVRQHLEPYVKHYKLKLKENEIESLSIRLAEELQKLGLLL